jgi:hypothetical protein
MRVSKESGRQIACAARVPINTCMKKFARFILDADDPTELSEGLSTTVLRAAGVASALKIRGQLSKMTTPDGKAIASALITLSSLIVLSRFSAAQDET